MSYEFKPGNIGIKIEETPSMAKSISIIRKYNSLSMSDIKKAIESNEYVLVCPYIDHQGVRMIRRCYNELAKAGITVSIYEHDRPATLEFLSNLIKSHRQTDREVQAQIYAENR